MLLLFSQGWADPVVYQKRWVYDTPVHLITVDLNSKAIVVRPLMAPAGKTMDFERMVAQSHPLAAINGTFFDTRTSVVIGNLVSDGRLLAEGAIGTSLTIDDQGRGDIINSAGRLGRYQDWSNTQFGISGGPTLLVSGQYLVTQPEGFSDPSLFVPRPRTALGLTASNKLLMVNVTRSVSLWELARIMKALGARQAVNLDGGTSTGMAYQGSLIVRPGRRQTNLVGVFGIDRAPTASSRGAVLAQRAVAHYQKGNLLLAKGKPLQARSQLRQAVAKAPGQARYWSAYARSEERMGEPQKAAEAYLKASRIYLEHYKADQAMKLAQRATQLAPQRADAQLVLAQAALQNNQRGLSSQAFRAVLRLQPGHPVATRALAAQSQKDFQTRSNQQLQHALRVASQAIFLKD
ncbi:MAG: phosphodiester glycosidase family protein [Candidatus Eremiobacteraeota bacterium]|nr:phosphodiester glycosidase family protein [Candidatus Eremiobacteraeota bacterium]